MVGSYVVTNTNNTQRRQPPGVSIMTRRQNIPAPEDALLAGAHLTHLWHRREEGKGGEGGGENPKAT